MELLTIIISGLLLVVTPVGLLVDSTLENTIRKRLEKAEDLAVRVDNAPSYQILQGKVQRLRVAGRGIHITDYLRIDTLELDSDRIALDWQQLPSAQKNNLNRSLREPLQAGVRLILKEVDLNQTLRSPTVVESLQTGLNQALAGLGSASTPRYQVLNPQLQLLAGNRLRLEVELRRRGNTNAPSRSLQIMMESEVKIRGGYKVELTNLVGSINNKSLSPRLLSRLQESASQALDLRRLEQQGVIIRILQLKTKEQKLKIAGFVRFSP